MSRCDTCRARADHARRNTIQSAVILVTLRYGDEAGEWLLAELNPTRKTCNHATQKTNRATTQPIGTEMMHPNDERDFPDIYWVSPEDVPLCKTPMQVGWYWQFIDKDGAPHGPFEDELDAMENFCDLEGDIEA